MLRVSQSERHEHPSVGFSALMGAVLFSFEMRRYLLRALVPVAEMEKTLMRGSCQITQDSLHS